MGRLQAILLTVATIAVAVALMLPARTLMA